MPGPRYKPEEWVAGAPITEEKMRTWVADVTGELVQGADARQTLLDNGKLYSGCRIDSRKKKSRLQRSADKQRWWEERRGKRKKEESFPTRGGTWREGSRGGHEHRGS